LPCKKKPFSNSELIDAKMGSLMGACYLLLENDFHSRNDGFNNEGILCRIDFDQNILPLAGVT
jgi:hypothetical protein